MVFENFDRWRKHDAINVNLRRLSDWKHIIPGFGIGMGLFVIYVGLEKMGMLGEEKHHGGGGGGHPHHSHEKGSHHHKDKH
jgi:hypothetical protein